MGKETELTVWEAIPPEHREILIVSTQEAVKALQELSDKISASITQLMDAVAEVFLDAIPVLIDEIEKAFGGLDIASQRRKKWKPVKNTVPRYHCAQRKILPHARSCC